MPKIQFKRKKSTGVSSVKLSAGEPLYNLQDKKFYIGASDDSTPVKHLTEVTVGSAGTTNKSKISIGEASSNDFTIKAGTGTSLTTSGREITIASNPTIENKSSGAKVAFTIDGKAFEHTVNITIPGSVESAGKLTNARTITLAGDATGSVSFDGSQNVTLTADVKSSDEAAKLSTARTIALSGAVTGNTTFDGSADKTIATTYALNDSKVTKKVVRNVSTDADGKLTTEKGELKAGTGISINESGTDIEISATTTLTNESKVDTAGTTVAFDINGQKFSQVVAIDGGSLAVGSADKLTTGRKLTLTGDASGNVTFDGSRDVELAVTVADNSHNHAITATSGGTLLSITPEGGTNSVKYTIAPYASQRATASFDISSTNPSRTDRLNYNGDFYATDLFGKNATGEMKKAVLEGDSRLSDSRTPKSHSHGNISNGGELGTASMVVITDGNKKVTTHSTVTSTELGHLGGVKDKIQTQLDGKAPTSHASAQTTYGVSSASNYGHSKASATSPKMAGTAAVGNETGTFARGDHVHPTDTTRASSSHKHKVSSAVTSGGPSATVECVNITVSDGVLNVSSVTAAGNTHTHSVTITDAETGGPIE